MDIDEIQAEIEELSDADFFKLQEWMEAQIEDESEEEEEESED